MDSFKNEFSKIYERYYSPSHLLEIQAFKQRLAGQTIVLFGAAWIGDFFWSKLDAMGFRVTCFADNFASGVTPSGHSPILSPAQLRDQYPDATVIISSDKARDSIFSQLIKLGYLADQIIQYPQELLSVLDMEHFKPHLEGYHWAYDFFKDDLSKRIILQRINCYLFGDSVDRSECPQYFETDSIKLGNDEVFLDGGFFTGDTTEEFIKQVHGQYRHIYAFEPDKYVIDKAKPLLDAHPNITLIPKGLFDREATLKFASTGGTSRASGGNLVDMDGENVISVPVTAIDTVFSDCVDTPTFIKMDIEGAEQAALMGAKCTITTHKPRLAICVYHKPEDMYQLPQLIHSFRPDYRYTLRHYAHYFWETVMYAV